MKKYFWIIAIFAALLLLLPACGGNPRDDDEEEEEETRGVPIDGTEAWWVAPSQIGRDRKYPDNRVPIIGEDDDASYVHIFWIPHGINLPDNRDFQITVVFEYQGHYDTWPIDMMWQCGFDPYGTWARSSTEDDYIQMVYPYDIYEEKVRPGRVFTGSNWDETKWGNGKTTLSIPEMTGLCIQIPMDFEEDVGFIKIHDISFANVSTNVLNPGPPITGPHPPQSDN